MTGTFEPRNLPDLLRVSALRYPERPSVADRSEELTYEALFQRSSTFAAGLRDHGIGPGDVVALALERSTDYVALIHGVLSLGATYVPLDLQSPRARLGEMVRDANPRLVVVDGRGASLLPGAMRLLMFAELKGRRSRYSDPPAEVDPQAVAAILFTSGSTGSPKGVPVTHAGVCAFVGDLAETIALAEGDVVISVSQFHFDLSTFDLFGSVRAGACVRLASPGDLLFGASLARTIAASRASVLYAVPSMYGQLLERAFPADLESLRICMFAGEIMPEKVLRRLRASCPTARLFNLFGPTETNVCLICELSEATNPADIPIGTPPRHTTVWLEGDAGIELVEGSGEIVVCGPAVMRGYWNGEPLPRAPSGHSVYHTGDFAFLHEDGEYRFLGRGDGRAKRSGHRVDVSEIERCLTSDPSVEQCVVTIAQRGKRLVAFVRVTSGGADLGALDARCRLHLPYYMIPEEIRLIDRFPLLSNGKLDKVALTDLANSNPGNGEENDSQ